MDIHKVVLPVAAGRNLAVLVEAAVRDTVLKLRGINTLQEFMMRQTTGDGMRRVDRSSHKYRAKFKFYRAKKRIDYEFGTHHRFIRIRQKSVALRHLEDMGYYCVDNLPANLLEPWLQK